LSEAAKSESTPPLLAFDGDCRICVGSIRGLERWGILGDLETMAATLVTGPDRQLLDQHRRAGEIVLLMNDRSQALTGAAAFRWILQRRYPGFLTKTLNWLPVYAVMTLVYRLVASWRRILLPPETTPDPLFPEPGWVATVRAMLSLLFLLAAPAWVSWLHQQSGLGNGFEFVSPVKGPAPSFLLVSVILLGNALFARVLGFRRLVDLVAVQSLVLIISLLGIGALLTAASLITEIPLIVVCMIQASVSAWMIQKYWIWLGLQDGKKGLTAQLITTLAVSLGGATLWTGYQPLTIGF
jgi:predicted DCC family thiol-disulfide oxidoreductase YuxK